MIAGKIPCSRSELNLAITLNGGQSFRWKTRDDGKSFRGVFAGCIWSLRQSEDYVHYVVHAPLDEAKNHDSILHNYFRLNVSLRKLLEKWAKDDSHFAKSYDKTVGVRMLNQDIVENLFSFICSSNNNIIRISGMVEKLCKFYGDKIGVIEDEEYYDFPSIEALSGDNVESKLRKEGFGYRAAYISKSARDLKLIGGQKWLLDLHKDKGTSYDCAKTFLMGLTGIGPKVADCICLMSLGHLDAIPVDTHIFQVACVHYTPHLKKQKTVTPKIHKEISDHLRELWGEFAGWAQAVVFCSKINNDVSLPKSRKRSKPETNVKSKNCKR